MIKVLLWCKKEFMRMLPVALFFLVAFSLVDATDRIINKNALDYYSFFSCVIASLIMGKIVLIADYLSISSLFSNKPLLYVTLWKSFLYVCCSMILRLIEHSIPALVAGATFSELYQKIIEHIEKPLFWIAQAWLAYLFVIFVGCRELIFSVGSAKVKKLFLGVDP